ncbi:hypothetical protein C8R44DRAFT_727093 [Mycena epipterygia]|nr:hypothetical protein C8R44DRAFT_727093 [Mycena epipterygia]
MYSHIFGRSEVRTQAECSQPFVQKHRLTGVAAMALGKGIIGAKVVEGSICRKSYVEFLQDSVMPLTTPYPGPRSVLVMDNVCIHHGLEVEELALQYVMYPITAGFPFRLQSIDPVTESVRTCHIVHNQFVVNSCREVVVGANNLRDICGAIRGRWRRLGVSGLEMSQQGSQRDGSRSRKPNMIADDSSPRLIQPNYTMCCQPHHNAKEIGLPLVVGGLPIYPTHRGNFFMKKDYPKRTSHKWYVPHISHIDGTSHPSSKFDWDVPHMVPLLAYHLRYSPHCPAMHPVSLLPPTLPVAVPGNCSIPAHTRQAK